MRILIAEDDLTLSDALERFLRMSGHAVYRAADGKSALQLLDTGEFDLLILDHGLPRLDGTEVLERARQHSGRLTVILISAAEDAALRVRRRGLSVDAFLIKPFGLDALDAAIQGLVRGTAALPALRIAMFGPLRCDAVSAWLDGDLLELPPPVLGVLQLLIEHGGSVVSSEAIFKRLSAYGAAADDQMVAECIEFLQRQLSRSDRVRLVSVRGLGYCLSQVEHALF